MARKSVLSEKQWAQIQSRLLAGEGIRPLAREFGVSDTAIRKRFSSQNKQVKDVAQQVVAADAAFKALPVSLQITAQSLIDDLKAVSMHLAGAAKFGAATAHRLSGIAHGQVDKIDDANPMESQDVLQGISALMKIANDSSTIGMNLLNANKDMLREAQAVAQESKADLLRDIAAILPR